MITTQADNTKWKHLGALAPFVYFNLPTDFKTRFPEYTFHYECVEGDLDECDYTYIEIDGVPVILQKYRNLDIPWEAMVDLRINNQELTHKMVKELVEHFNIKEVSWVRDDF